MSFIFPASPDYSGQQNQASGSSRAPNISIYIIVAGLLAFATLWLGQLWAISVAPPEDNIEQLIWTTSLEWGYYKHPPLPTWLLWPLVKIFGTQPLLTLVLGGATTLGAIAIMWRLLLSLRGQQYALIALLAALCITYYNRRLDVYNHDTVLMVIVALSAALTWKAHQTGEIKWWAVLGLCLGLGAITKYQIAVTMTCTLAFWLYSNAWKTRRGRLGFAVMCLVISLIFLPHGIWMIQNDFAPIRYAMDSSLGASGDAISRITGASQWLAEQIFNRMAPAWLFLLVAWCLLKLRAPQSFTASSIQPVRRINQRDRDVRALLLIWGLLPLAFMPFVGLVMGSHLLLRWASPFLIFAIPAAFELFNFTVAKKPIPMRPIWIAFFIVQGLLLVASFWMSYAGGQSKSSNKAKKFDYAQLAQVLEQPAKSALGGTICLISGNTELAGGLAIALSDKPQVLIDGRLDRSPWLTQESLRNCGIVELAMNSQDAAAVPVGQMYPGLSWRAVLPKP